LFRLESAEGCALTWQVMNQPAHLIWSGGTRMMTLSVGGQLMPSGTVITDSPVDTRKILQQNEPGQSKTAHQAIPSRPILAGPASPASA